MKGDNIPIVVLVSGVDQLAYLLVEDSVMVRLFAAAHLRQVLEHFLREESASSCRVSKNPPYLAPSQQGMHPQDISIRSQLVEVRILHPISGIRQGQPRRIRPKLLRRVPEQQTIPRPLAHLLPIQHQMAVRPHPEGPLRLVIVPDRDMGVQAERQVVGHEVLAGGADVHGVEVVELVLHGVGLGFGDVGVGGEGA